MKNSSTIASLLAVIVALYINRVQPKMKIGSDVIVSEKNGAIIEFLSRTNSKGFIKCCDVALVRKKNDNWLNYVVTPSFLSDYLDDNLRISKNISTDQVTCFMLNDKYNSNITGIVNYLNSINYHTDEFDRYTNKINNNQDVSEYYFQFFFKTNDRYRKTTVLVNIQDLIKCNFYN